MTVTSPPPALDAGSWSYDLLPLLDARVVFVHIPKTGGLSIANAVYRTEGGGHRTVEDYKRELGPEIFASLVSFTVVREPTERLASAFRFLKRGGINDLDQAFAAEHLAPFETLEEFVTGWLTPESARSQVHFRPQHEFVCGSSGRPEVDHILRHERLQDDYDALRPVFGGSPLPYLNATTGSSAREAAALSPRALRIVANVYSKDFVLFGYPFPSL